MEFFIKDLYEQLERLQIETLKTNKLPLTVYKTHHISNEDFEKIKAIFYHLIILSSQIQIMMHH
jgi:hypothetical protein